MHSCLSLLLARFKSPLAKGLICVVWEWENETNDRNCRFSDLSSQHSMTSFYTKHLPKINIVYKKHIYRVTILLPIWSLRLEYSTGENNIGKDTILRIWSISQRHWFDLTLQKALEDKFCGWRYMTLPMLLFQLKIESNRCALNGYFFRLSTSQW